MTNLPARVAIMAVGYVIAAVGFAVAGVFCCIAAYAFLCTVLSPALAALSTAGVALVLTFLVLAVARILSGSLRRRGRSSAPPPANLLGAEIGKMLGQDAQAYISANPKAALMLAVCGGFLVGLSPRLRQMAKTFFRL